MNKKTLKIAGWALGLSMAVAGIGAAVGASFVANANEPMMVKAADKTFYSLTPSAGSNSTYASNCDVTVNGITWNVTGNASLIPWRIGGKSITGTDRAVYSKTAMGSAITKVELVVGNASSITVNSLKLIVASDAGFNTKIDEVSATFAASSTITFTPTTPATEWATGAYYKFVFNVTVSGSSNKFVEFSGAKFYQYVTAPTVSGVSITGTTTVSSGSKGLATTKLTGTVSYSSGSGTNGLTWESSDETVATVSSTGLVTFLNNGSSTITATSTEDNTKSASVVVTAANLEEAKGTANNPFSIEEICSFIDGGAYDGTSTEYAYGIVSEKGEWSTQYNNANVFLTDNGNPDSENSIELFRFEDLEGYDAISVGDYVVVSGVWTKYNDIYETKQGFSGIDTASISKVGSIDAISADNSYPTGTVLTKSDFQVDATYANDYVAEDVNGYTFTVNGESDGALVEGNNTIVISYLNKTKTLNITGVSTHITAIVVDSSKTVEETKTVQLTALTDPESGYSDTLVWESSDTSKATVDQNGLVAGVSAGSATITVFADANNNGELDNGEVYGTCAITVTERAVSGLSIQGKTTSFAAGDSFTLGNATITVTFSDSGTLPLDEDDANLTYYIGSQDAVNNKTADTISIGDTLLGSYDGLYIKAYYKNVGATAYRISVSAPFDYSAGTFYKVTSEPADWNGNFILVYETGKLAFHGADAAKSSTSVAIDNSNRIAPVNNLAVLQIASMDGGYSIKVKNGAFIDKYLGATSDSNGLSGNDSAVANTISLDANGNVDISSSSAHLRFNAGASDMRFRYYKSTSYTSQKSIQIYKYRSNVEVVSEFVTNNMKLSQYVGDESYVKDRCDANYSAAKTAFNNLTTAQRELFVSEGGVGGQFEDAYNRLVEWAAAHHETIGTDNGDENVLKQAVAVSNHNTFEVISDNGALVAVTITVAAGLIGATSFAFIRRKKEDR